VNKHGTNFLRNWKPSIADYSTGSNLKVSATLDQRCTLIYLDFDTHTSGQTGDVQILFDRLRDHLPELLEPVVNERGRAIPSTLLLNHRRPDVEDWFSENFVAA
jgi:hypothetical protein